MLFWDIDETLFLSIRLSMKSNDLEKWSFLFSEQKATRALFLRAKRPLYPIVLTRGYNSRYND